jgi:hypothetical protein
MTTRLKTLALAIVAAAALAAPAHATVLFSQDFSGGLGANESLGGRFAVGGGKMGHVTGPYVNNERSRYDLKVDLAGVTDALFSFDWTSIGEINWDGWNLLGAVDGAAFDPQHPLLPKAGTYNRWVSALGAPGSSGIGDGHAVFDLTSFAGKTVNLRLQFASDFSNVGAGVTFDNLVVSGTPKPVSAAPEPAAWALMVGGFLGAGGMLRRRRLQLA